MIRDDLWPFCLGAVMIPSLSGTNILYPAFLLLDSPTFLDASLNSWQIPFLVPLIYVSQGTDLVFLLFFLYYCSLHLDRSRFQFPSVLLTPQSIFPVQDFLLSPTWMSEGNLQFPKLSLCPTPITLVWYSLRWHHDGPAKNLPLTTCWLCQVGTNFTSTNSVARIYPQSLLLCSHPVTSQGWDDSI